MIAIRILEYLDPDGRSPYAHWFEGLNALAAGNFSNVKGVGSGVFERTLNVGPDYRIYFGRDGQSVVILLGGSSKQRQQQAIEAAKARWTDYRRRKAKR